MALLPLILLAFVITQGQFLIEANNNAVGYITAQDASQWHPPLNQQFNQNPNQYWYANCGCPAITATTMATEKPPLPMSCAEVFEGIEGVYKIQVPGGRQESVYCIADRNPTKEAWTVIINRVGGDLSFDRSFKEYQDGFGVVFMDHFKGLELIYNLTNAKRHELLLRFKGKFGEVNIRYNNFAIGGPEDYFQFHTLGLLVEKPDYDYTLPADKRYNSERSIPGRHQPGFDDNNPYSLTDSFRSIVGNRFSARPIDFSEDKCANFKKTGWWFPEEIRDKNICGNSCFTTPFKDSRLKRTVHENVEELKGYIARATMAIRPYTGK